MADLHEGIGHGSVGLGAGISRQLLQRESSQQQLSSFNSQATLSLAEFYKSLALKMMIIWAMLDRHDIFGLVAPSGVLQRLELCQLISKASLFDKLGINISLSAWTSCVPLTLWLELQASCGVESSDAVVETCLVRARFALLTSFIPVGPESDWLLSKQPH
ncbi:hypothetical protein QC762_0029040 [Podospora pseudocomata]|uniref:Uncharacterized protein n=1 Tax=Podospora pseudocomata TaxID=2093779 RepID=A0ABR0GS19_9PEZI|nr:hypothetical protein QC762_0029040 [Podospora pseudocomata]